MKLVSPEQIKMAEKELINAVISHLDWDALKTVFKEKHNIELGEEIKTKGAEIRIRDSHLSYVLDLEVNLNLSIELDREGNVVTIEDGKNSLRESENDSEAQPMENNIPADSTNSIAESETLALGTEATENEINMEKWLKEGDQSSSEGPYEDALQEIGSVEHS